MNIVFGLVAGVILGVGMSFVLHKMTFLGCPECRNWWGHQPCCTTGKTHDMQAVYVDSIASGVPVITHNACRRCGSRGPLTAAGLQQEYWKSIGGVNNDCVAAEALVKLVAKTRACDNCDAAYDCGTCVDGKPHRMELLYCKAVAGEPIKTNYRCKKCGFAIAGHRGSVLACGIHLLPPGGSQEANGVKA